MEDGFDDKSVMHCRTQYIRITMLQSSCHLPAVHLFFLLFDLKPLLADLDYLVFTCLTRTNQQLKLWPGPIRYFRMMDVPADNYKYHEKSIARVSMQCTVLFVYINVALFILPMISDWWHCFLNPFCSCWQWTLLHCYCTERIWSAVVVDNILQGYISWQWSSGYCCWAICKFSCW